MSHDFTTTQSGAPLASDAHSLTTGPDGITALHDHALVEKLASFNRERVPERNPHAKGGGAFGEFVVTEFLVGGYGMLERLGMLTERSALKVVRWALRRRRGAGGPGYSVRWDQMDLGDPERPVTTVPRGDLRPRA